MDFFAVSFAVDIESDIERRSFCLLMAMIPIPNCSLLYMHSNSNNTFLKIEKLLYWNPVK